MNLPFLSQPKLVLIYRPRRDGRLSLPSTRWYGRLTDHQLRSPFSQWYKIILIGAVAIDTRECEQLAHACNSLCTTVVDPRHLDLKSDALPLWLC